MFYTNITRKWYFINTIALVVVFSSACTRKATEDGTQLKMSFDSSLSKPNANSKIIVPDGFMPMHMVVNLQFDGQIAIEEWSCEERDKEVGNFQLCAFPTSVDFNGRIFPRGSSRVVQVLLVYSNEEEKLIFAYDDVVNLDFNANELVVDIGSQWVQQNGGVSGHVGGHHGSLRSGRVEGYFQPPRPGRPRMKLFDEVMFSGWFQFMFFQGARVSYYHKELTGEEAPLFINKNLGDFESTLTGTQAVAAFNVPTFYEVHSDGDPVGNKYKSYKNGGEIYVMGFFDKDGNPRLNSSMFSLKVPTSNDFIAQAYRNILNGELLDPIDEFGTYRQTDGSSGGSEAQWATRSLLFSVGIDLANTNDMVQIHGMAASNATACSGVSPSEPVTSQCIQFVPQFVKNRGLIPFEGPFMVSMSIDGNYSSTLQNTSATAISWKLLPGVAGYSVQGLALFITDRETEFRDGYPCQEMALEAGIPSVGKRGLMDPKTPPVYFHRTLTVANTDRAGSYDFAQSNIDLTNKQAVVCPWEELNGLKIFSTVGANNHDFWSGGTNSENNGPTVATKLSLKNHGPTNFTYLNTFACTPFEVTALDDQNNIAALPNYPYKVEFNQNEGSFYLDSDCLSSVAFPQDLYHSQQMFWFKADLAIGNSGLSVIAHPGQSVALNAAPLISIPISAHQAATQLLLHSPSEFYTTQCNRIIVTAADTNGVPTKVSLNTQIIPSIMGAGFGTFYEQGACDMTPLGTPTLNSGSTNRIFEVKGTTIGSATLTTGNDRDLNNANMTINIVDPGLAEYAVLESQSGTVLPSTCVELKLATYKIMGPGNSVKAPAPTGITYNITSSQAGGNFYTDGSMCATGSGATSSITQFNGTLSQSIYYKTSEIGNFVINVIANDSKFSTVKNLTSGI